MAFVLVAATGCGAATGSGEHACTAMAARSGISVEIAPEFTDDIAGTAQVRACWAGSCHTREVELRPTTKATDSTCAGGACSAQLVPTGAASGFATFPELPTSQVRVMLTLSGRSGDPVVEETLKLTPEQVHPNGPRCGGAGAQADLAVTPSGNVRAK